MRLNSPKEDRADSAIRFGIIGERSRIKQFLAPQMDQQIEAIFPSIKREFKSSPKGLPNYKKRTTHREAIRGEIVEG